MSAVESLEKLVSLKSAVVESSTSSRLIEERKAMADASGMAGGVATEKSTRRVTL